MITPLARTVRKLKQAISGRLPKRRDDSGLTTLEWLLIVAAVAGLAALAVVLVQNVVRETGEQIAGSSARKTAAEVSAENLEQQSKTLEASDVVANGRFDTWAKWDNYFTSQCNTIGVTFSDADVTVTSDFVFSSDPISVAEAATATETGAGAIPRALCNVS